MNTESMERSFSDKEKEEDCDALNNFPSEDTFDAPLIPEDPFGILESEGLLYCPSSDVDTDSSGFDHEDDRRNLKPSKERKKTCKKNSVHEGSSDVNNKIPRIVTGFSVGHHIVKNHSIEIDLSQSAVKKDDICLIYLGGRATFWLTIVPALKEGYVPEREKLPCDNCLGYFSSKLLNRHKKRCFKDKLVSGDQNEKLFNVCGNFRIDHILIEQVFPHMRANRICFAAKKDNLICEFSARYMKTHRENMLFM
nr:unnamed protein product [Callosobruchus analis]